MCDAHEHFHINTKTVSCLQYMTDAIYETVQADRFREHLS